MIKSKLITYEITNLIESNQNDATPYEYLADWEMLKQAVFHPLVNAVKFNRQKGKIEVKINMRYSSLDKAYLECSIKDSGYGIEEDDIQNLFQAFKISDMDSYGT